MDLIKEDNEKSELAPEARHVKKKVKIIITVYKPRHTLEKPKKMKS